MLKHCARFSAARAVASALFAAMLLGACAESPSTVTVDEHGQTVVKLSPPGQLSTRAINPDNLVLAVSINNLPLDMSQSGESWTGSRFIPEGSDVNLEVRWAEVVDQQSLPLAVATDSILAISSNVNFSVVDESYVSTGEGFDADADLISNLAERRQDTDPFDASDPSEITDVQASVFIPGSLRPNIVDGRWDNSFWSSSQQTDRDGVDLLVDNLIVNEGAGDVDGGRYKWAAQHNGEFLSLFVFGKVSNTGLTNLHGDAAPGQLHNDDTLEIFIDGDLSAGLDYDRVDDMHIMIPLLRGSNGQKLPNKSGEADTRIERGANVMDEVTFDVSTVEFATCLCEGSRVTWEVRLNMDDLGIPRGKTFGFEIQIDQDDDGGNRDAKWAWDFPARTSDNTNAQTDVTWRYPVTMGEAKILPFPGQ